MSVFHVSASKPPKRDVQFKMVMSADERTQLEALAQQADVNASELIRIAVNEYAQRNRSKKNRKQT